MSPASVTDPRLTPKPRKCVPSLRMPRVSFSLLHHNNIPSRAAGCPGCPLGQGLEALQALERLASSPCPLTPCDQFHKYLPSFSLNLPEPISSAGKKKKKHQPNSVCPVIWSLSPGFPCASQVASWKDFWLFLRVLALPWVSGVAPGPSLPISTVTSSARAPSNFSSPQGCCKIPREALGERELWEMQT